MLDAPMKVLGFEEHPMEDELTKCLRYELARWACALKHPVCIEAANRKLAQHLNNPKEHK